MGHRPSLPDSLPIIGRSPKHNQVIFAFGHQHLGLTQAAVTADLISQTVLGQPLEVDMKPFAVDRF
jgi:D-amino-acid dehydrogenase